MSYAGINPIQVQEMLRAELQQLRLHVAKQNAMIASMETKLQRSTILLVDALHTQGGRIISDVQRQINLAQKYVVRLVVTRPEGADESVSPTVEVWLEEREAPRSPSAFAGDVEDTPDPADAPGERPPAPAPAPAPTPEPVPEPSKPAPAIDVPPLKFDL